MALTAVVTAEPPTAADHPPAAATAEEMTRFIYAGLRERDTRLQSLRCQYALEKYWNEDDYREPPSDEYPTHELHQGRLWIEGERWAEETLQSIPKERRLSITFDGERHHSYRVFDGHRQADSFFSPDPPALAGMYLDIQRCRPDTGASGRTIHYQARYVGEETCAGRRTYKLEAKPWPSETRTWWISPELGFAVLMTRLTHTPRTPEEAPLSHLYYLFDRFVEAGDGLWVADATRRLSVEHRANGQPTWTILFRFTALELELNRPSQGLPLDWIIPLGARIFDDRGSIYPAGGDLRDVTAAMQARRPPDPVLLVPEPSAAAAAYTHPPAPR
ncbi:MAG: hypothetical protein HUU35_18585 [Armatimonadetes bacterium]|nr:hypothetical protein [Armatimonadota bacterium]